MSNARPVQGRPLTDSRYRPDGAPKLRGRVAWLANRASSRFRRSAPVAFPVRPCWRALEPEQADLGRLPHPTSPALVRDDDRSLFELS